MKTHNISIGLMNPKSPENVCSVQRAAGNYSADIIYYTGSRYPRALNLNPDTPKMGRRIGENIAVIGVNDLINAAPQGSKIVCIEFAKNAQPLPAYQHPENAYYIFGPEDANLSQDIIDEADAVVYVPTQGCMNLAATVNVVLYDRLAKSLFAMGSEELIQNSRDTNNNLIARCEYKNM